MQRFFLPGWLLLSPLVLSGQGVLKAQPLAIPYLAGAGIQVDGSLEEPVWSQAFETSAFFQTKPGENLPPTRKTVVKVFHNGKAVCVGIRCLDPEPRQILKKRFTRDGNPGGSETILLALDPSGNAQKAVFVMITPQGDVTDGLLDLVSGSVSRDVDFEFHSAARVHEGGYDVELEIPFESLPIPSRPGAQTWYVYMERGIPRTDFEVVSNVPLNRASTDPKDGLAPASIEGVPSVSEKRWHFLPAVVGSARRVEENADADSVTRQRDGDVELTGWWSPSPSTQARFTWNPDFSQVEADAPYQRVNNRFPVFIPEKRPFFLDPNDPFKTSFRLVHTRAIVDPRAGLRFSTNQGPVGLYVLSALERNTPAERFGLEGPTRDAAWNILSASHSSERGRYGLLATSLDFGGASNRVLSLSGNPRWGGVQWDLQAVRSFTKMGGAGVSEGGAYLAGARFKPGKEWLLSGEWEVLSPDFAPMAGFIPDVGVRKGFAKVEWEHRPKVAGAFFRGAIAGFQARLQREWDGATRREAQDAWFILDLPHQISVNLSGSRGREHFVGSFFRTGERSLSVNWMEKEAFQAAVYLAGGQDVVFNAARPRQGRFRLEYLFLRHAFGGLSFENQWTNYELREEGGPWAARQAFLTSTAEFIFGQGMSFTARYQWDRARLADFDLDNPTGYLQILFNYRPSAFTQFYVGFNRFSDLQKTLAGLRTARRVEDNLFIKLAYKL